MQPWFYYELDLSFISIAGCMIAIRSNVHTTIQLPGWKRSTTLHENRVFNVCTSYYGSKLHNLYIFDSSGVRKTKGSFSATISVEGAQILAKDITERLCLL